ncbi:MAG: POTRA domain-containing protein [Terriglobales bacterium]
MLAVCFVLLGYAAAQQQTVASEQDHTATATRGAEPAIPAGVPVSSTRRVSSFDGLPVRAIELHGVSEDAKVLDYLRSLIAQEVNQPLDRAKIRKSLQALYATGRFADLQVEADRTPQNDVRLIFRAQESYFVGAVTVQGNPRRPTGTQLVNATKLQLGEPYSPEKVDAAVRNMQALLMENGFYKAEITHQESFDPATQQVDIHFRLNPDGSAHIGEVTIVGSPGYSPEEIQDIADFSPGHTITAQRVTKAMQKLRKKYQKKDRLEAQVAITDRKFHPESNTVDYVFRIDQGPKVDVRVEGAGISRGKLKKLVPVFEEGSIDDDLLNEGVRNLRDYFQMQGFFDVRVNWTKEADEGGNRVHVIFHVDRGTRHKLVGVHIDYADTVALGRPFFDPDTIRERMQVHAANFLLAQGLYSESMLARDIQAIEALYRSNGFPHVRVTREVQDDYQGEVGRMLVTLRISEGPQVRVASLRTAGNRTVPTETIEGLMSTIPGQPYSQANVAADRDSVLNYYFNNGYPEAQCDFQATPTGSDPNLMDVVVTITEGRQVFVDRVLVSGINYTRPYVVRREIELQPGEPLNRLAMQDSQKNLYDLGIFNEVNMAVQNPNGDARYKNMLFRISEAKRWTFNYGFGFEVQTGGQPANVSQINTAPAPGVRVPPNSTPPNNGIPIGSTPQDGTGFTPSVSFELTRINFQGRDHTVGLKTRLSNLQQRALISYDAPHLFNRRNARLTFSALYDNRRDVRTFTSERLEGSAQLEHVLSRTSEGQPISSLLFRYSYRRVRVDASSLAISPELVPLLSKPVLLGMPSFTYIRDKRNNPLDPSKGNYTTFDFGVSARAFGSGSVTGTAQQGANGLLSPQATAANFTRLFAQNATYAPLPWIKGLVFARSTRIGVEHALGSNAPKLAIPLPERFFAGGAMTHRGFALNQAGPRDLTTGFPIGGNALFVNNLEFRFPPPVLPFVGSNLSFVLFHDFGNVFQTAQQMLHSFGRWQQPNDSVCGQEGTHQQCRFDYMSQAVGTGIRYRTPIGPVRVDFSYNLNPPSFPFYVQCPSFTWATQPLPCSALPPNALVFQRATLRHFNFFFSIGQTF